MSINETIRAAVLPLVPICEPNTYGGDEEEYCTFNYSEQPGVFAEGRPDCIMYLLQLHWFLPAGVNPLRKKVQLRHALLAARCTYPSTTDASDEDGQHYVFECQCVDGDV